MNQIPTIREETTADILRIREVIGAAFGRPGEADLVDNLRSAGALTFSIVATIDQHIVGHVAFSPITSDTQHSALALAPVAVAPDYQRQGIGSSLIQFGLEQCRHSGHRVVVVLGSPAYYRRFGFMPASEFGIKCPFPVPLEAFMVLELAPRAATGYRGAVRYHPAFALV